jgi:hypothetical protein
MGWIGLVVKVGMVFTRSVEFIFKSNTMKTVGCFQYNYRLEHAVYNGY